MLRSAHYFIYQRSFDVRRTPEYYNRILLGAISGGAIILFITNLSNDDGSSINLGAAALGFVAGYSTDLLFNTIERIVTAMRSKPFRPIPRWRAPRRSARRRLRLLRRLRLALFLLMRRAKAGPARRPQM
jgi:hypothetical protein